MSVAFQAMIGLANIKFGKYKLIRKAQPESWQDVIVPIAVLGAAALTFGKKSIFPSLIPAPVVAVVLLVLGIAAPLLGLAENRWRSGTPPIFDTTRFRGHLLGNCFGALAVGLFFWAGQTVDEFTDSARNLQDASAFNIVLPMTTVIIFAFVRQQQIEKCPNIDRMVLDKESP